MDKLLWAICSKCGDISDVDLYSDNSEWNKLKTKDMAKNIISNEECMDCCEEFDTDKCLVLTEEELTEKYDELNKKYNYDEKDFSDYLN